MIIYNSITFVTTAGATNIIKQMIFDTALLLIIEAMKKVMQT